MNIPRPTTNEVAKTLRTSQFRVRRVRARKGKGSYTRKGRVSD